MTLPFVPIPAMDINSCCCKCSTAGAAAAERRPGANQPELEGQFATITTSQNLTNGGGAGAQESPTDQNDLNDPRSAAARDRARQRFIREKIQVWSVGKCNGARDCLDSAAWEADYNAAYRNALNWVSLDPKRTVEIKSAPDGWTITSVQGTGATRYERAELSEEEQFQRRLAQREILGRF
jgi:hypothetical protein